MVALDGAPIDMPGESRPERRVRSASEAVTAGIEYGGEQVSSRHVYEVVHSIRCVWGEMVAAAGNVPVRTRSWSRATRQSSMLSWSF